MSRSRSPRDERPTPVPEPTRGGEDVRRRGWFWHWNALVTQYAPLIGLKGVGLLNSYTVWTDRREESPHRGFAFPSQQSEADFYGEDRAELITINKILVALDLIEIRKEMVVRADPQGRRWKVPHNFYRVKDHGDDFTLSTDAVLRVAELAAQDRAVYRYVRRVFSPRFAPIDGDNVWTRILPEVRQTPLWSSLAAKAGAEEDRASARSRAGHAARKGASSASPADSPFFVPSAVDEAANSDSSNDSDSVMMREQAETTVDDCNSGMAMDVAGTNNGLPPASGSGVAPRNRGRATSVAPLNTTYDQSSTTTKNDETHSRVSLAGSGDNASWRSHDTPLPGMTTAGPRAVPPDDAAGEAGALRAFAHANDREPTPAERKLLRDLAARFLPVAAAAHLERAEVPASGWGWLEAAVWEAVEAGSAFVAPRRLREIMARWEREGFPAGEATVVPTAAPMLVRPVREGSPAPRPLPAQFTIEEVGLSNRQVWAAVLAEVARQGQVTPGDLETWFRPASLVGREGDTLLVGAPNEVARERLGTRLDGPLGDALRAVIGAPLPVRVMLADDVASAPDEAAG